MKDVFDLNYYLPVRIKLVVVQHNTLKLYKDKNIYPHVTHVPVVVFLLAEGHVDMLIILDLISIITISRATASEQ